MRGIKYLFKKFIRIFFFFILKRKVSKVRKFHFFPPNKCIHYKCLIPLLFSESKTDVRYCSVKQFFVIYVTPWFPKKNFLQIVVIFTNIQPYCKICLESWKPIFLLIFFTKFPNFLLHIRFVYSYYRFSLWDSNIITGVILYEMNVKCNGNLLKGLRGSFLRISYCTINL